MEHRILSRQMSVTAVENFGSFTNPSCLLLFTSHYTSVKKSLKNLFIDVELSRLRLNITAAESFL
jgi:hypothetical protein